MASVNINYNCGCGYTTKHLEEAINHSDSQGHSLTVVGTIKRPEVVEKLRAPNRTVTKALEDIEAMTQGSAEFASLRARLGSKP